ncbi:MAG TPA: PAS domain S-box protein [Cyclobacteriaceae bacterium]|nr:PAS domain S-box protein [Cyclobacteriaceae bacterium]
MNQKSTLEPLLRQSRLRKEKITESRKSQTFIEFAPDPTIILNRYGNIVTSNDLASELFGYAKSSLREKDIEALIPGIRGKLRKGNKSFFISPKTLRIDGDSKLYAVQKSRSKILIDISISPIRIGGENYSWAAIRKVGHLKFTEDDPKITQAYARSLIEAALDPLVTISPEGKITDVNEASVRATGVPRIKLIGTDFSDYFTEPQKAREGYQQVFAKGLVADYPLTLRDKKGKLTDVLYNASVYKDDAGNVLGVLAAARDITRLKQTEEQFRKIQAYTRSLIETSLDPQITKGPDGRITDVNEATVQVTGVPREKLIGTHFPDYFTEPGKAEEAYQQAFYQGVVRNYPLGIRHVSGKITDVLYNATVFKDEEGTVQGVFASARDITDRKQVEEELKKQQAYTRSLIEASLDPMVAISPGGKITDVNEALVKATGVQREKLIGTDFSDYFTEPDKARDGYQKVFAEGFVADLPLRLRHNKRDVLYNASVYRDEKEKVLGVFASARDITDRKHAEEEIKKQQVYTRSLIEASLDPMVAISPEGKITDVNEALVKATDVDREKLIGTDFSDYFTEPDKAREGYQKVFADGYVADLPLRIRHNKRDVLYNASVYRDEKGKVLGAFASARDITDRKQAEEEIKKQQVYTRSLIEASLDPMVAISPEGKITDVNEALVKATGVEREKLIGTDFSDYFTEPEKAREGYQQIFAKGFVADSPLTIRHNLRDVLYNASVYRDEKEKVLGAFASARDITAQRKQEVKIKTLNEELEQRIIELESFSYSVSHDLRAPLRGIDGFIAIFLTKYFEKVDSEGQRLLGNVRRNVNKMGSLIDELLTLSRIGMKDIQITTINMNELVHTVLEELVEMKGKSTVTVNPLPSVRGDIALIKQVLVNLISNAFKYSTKVEKPIIEIGCIHDDGEAQYYVKDNGVGFDMEYSNKLFGVFQRLHDPQEYQGTGVGLAIVKRIIIRHGGRVWAEGKEGQGATFYFSLKSH